MPSEEGRFARLKKHIDPMIRKLLLDLPDDQVDEDKVRQKYEQLTSQLAMLFGPQLGMPLTDDEIAELTEQMIEQYLHELAVNKPSGFAYKNKECVPWVRDIQDEDWYFWDRYERYLMEEKGWERKVVKTMAEDTLNILDLMVDPRPSSSPAGADRRGLVVADVQSGKTSNYIGLMARAADAGYKVIIVLAGIYNVLRSQTQIRIEEGFVGYNSNDNTPVGAGLISTEKRWRCGSTRTLDFGKKWLQPLMGTGSEDDNWVFVIKKNKSVLESLIQWLTTHPEIKGPLLLIDDEADNASINVKYAKDDVSVINGLIRRLLKHFGKSSYVGYTATPFANILIDPKAETDDEGEDIFPRSFIYTLEASTTYFGSDKVFGCIDGEGVKPKHVRYIEDIEDILPRSHKKDRPIPCLPGSLKQAVRTYALASAIRFLRGNGDEHTTMMVNVSPYKKVQGQVAELLKDYVRSLRLATRNYALLDDALKDRYMRDIYCTWQDEFSSESVAWNSVCLILYDVIRRIRVVVINSASSDALDYEAPNVEHAIAVGGYRLSRGLTLEGLLVSYYSRNSKAYDTLMQMARWFGYRPGYEDLCRVWMSRDAANWYSFVADATVELVSQLRNMRQLNSDPSVYGLMVRKSPSALVITARNKMGVGKMERHPLNLNNSFIETTALLRDKGIVESNYIAARKLIDSMLEEGLPNLPDTGKSVGFRSVPPHLVKEFIESYRGPESIAGQPQSSSVIASIDRLAGYMSNPLWDVVIVNGSNGRTDDCMIESIGGRTVLYEGRFPGAGSNAEIARVGNKSKLSSRDVEAFGLDADTKKSIDDAYEKTHGSRNTPGANYRKAREHPLLVIHFIRLRFRDTEHGINTYNDLINKGVISDWGGPKHQEKAVGWSISYPLIDDNSLLEFDYLLNGPAIYALEGYDDYDEDDPDEP